MSFPFTGFLKNGTEDVLLGDIMRNVIFYNYILTKGAA